ncbi:C2 domain-containing protein 3-like isoform X2 [Clytia hemisphaerica]|uniref:C2 domain-containing protein 3-like isoform X2 n=1 Tax=Clytia hemisphaerica TaxID=252671 RepID=UPI0034D6EBBF
MSSSIVVGSSLPPQVEGQLRCFLSIKVASLAWSIPQPPKDVQIQLHWWGDKAEGNLLRPQVDSDPNYAAVTEKVSEIHFPIRCGPRQFNSYVQDMGMLHMDVIYGHHKTKFAKLDIKDIGKLTTSKPVSGSYPVICTIAPFKSKQVGQLSVTVAFKTVSDTYNVTSSIVPTTDKEFSKTKRKSTSKLAKKKSSAEDKKKKHVHYSSQSPEKILYEEPFVEKNDHHEKEDISFVIGPGAKFNRSEESGKVSTKRNTTSIDGMEPLPPTMTVSKEHKIIEKNDHYLESPQPKEDLHSDDQQEAPNREKNSIQVARESLNDHIVGSYQGAALSKSSGGSNILSLLLEKGEKLRDDMVQSQIKEKSSQSSSKSQNSTNHEDEVEDSIISNLKDILPSHKQPKPFTNIDIEERTVDLLISEDKTEDYQRILKRFDVSSDEEATNISELSDPLHDSSLLSDLFYTTKLHGDKLADESSIVFPGDSIDHNDVEHRRTIETRNSEKKERVNKKDDVVDDTVLSDIDSFENVDLVSTKIEHNENTGSDYDFKKLLPDAITVETLTILGRVKSAKVTIRNLCLTNEDQPLGTVYFIEYKFPVATTDDQVSIAAETICNVSKSVDSRQSIVFERISIFPLTFNEEMVTYWWNETVCVKLYVKFNRNQKQILFAEGSWKLRDLLKSNNLGLNLNCDVLSVDGKREKLGILSVDIELLFDQNGGKSKLTKTMNKPMESSIPIRMHKQVVNTSTNSINKQQQPKLKPGTIITTKAPKRITTQQPLDALIINGQQQYYQEKQPTDRQSKHQETLLLDSLLVITEGRGITSKDLTPPHLYCVSRAFWNKEKGQTKICWNSSDPFFQYQQILAVQFDEDCMKKMKNNLMVIEVWSKSTTANKDKLIGMAKISLHQYHLSFQNGTFKEKLLNSQYPVVSIDDWISIHDVITSQPRGHLKVIHAIGSNDQIIRFLAMKGDQSCPRIHSSYPRNEQHRHEVAMEDTSSQKVEHDLEITIESVKNVFENGESQQEVWGESDCYVQYHFPTQHVGQDYTYDCFKSKTTLCVPNIIFNHNNKHVFTLSNNEKINNIFQQCSNKKNAINEIEFELWKRHYYPNIREQLIGKCTLPIVKLYALMTMHVEESVSSQSFSLPLISLDASQQEDTPSRGSLNLFVSYKKQPCFTSSSSRTRNGNGEMVGLSISILRMCSLKGCVDAFLRPGQKANPFVRFYISSMKDPTLRQTNHVINSSCPVFSHHVEFPIPIVQNKGGLVTSLAEILDDGYLVCEAYHCDVVEKGEVLLASGQIPLQGLLSKNNGIRQWFALSNTLKKRHHHLTLSAGIEIQIQFSNNDDRRNIINIARRVGWKPRNDVELNSEAWLSPQQTSRLTSSMKCRVNVVIDRIWLTNDVVEECFPCFKDLKRGNGLKIYARYKLYDQAPVITNSSHLKESEEEEEEWKSKLEESFQFVVEPTTSFAWYLHEELLEVQFWMTSSRRKERSNKLDVNDKIVGSLFVSLEEFSHSPFEPHTISDVSPLFKSDSSCICNASARICILFNQDTESDWKTLHRGAQNTRNKHSDEEDTTLETSKDEESLLNNICKTKVNEQNIQTPSMADLSANNKGVQVSVQIEEALHLPTYLSGDEHCYPSTYVTCQLPDNNQLMTLLASTTVKPKWNFRQELRLDFDKIKGKLIKFTVWRCVGTMVDTVKDIQIGIAKIDTTSLFHGMKSINGWYNIHNFNNQCCGQLKVAIIPSTPLSPSKSNKYFKKYDIVEPCNLDLIMFPKSPQLSVVENDGTSSCSLFEQLRQNLNDLEQMTLNIKNRTQNNVAEQNPTSILHNPQQENVQLTTNERESVSFSLQEQNVDSATSSSINTCRTSPNHQVQQQIDQPENDQNQNSHSPDISDTQETKTHFEYPERDNNSLVFTRNHSNEPSIQEAESIISSQDSSCTITEQQSVPESLNDSTDDLLEHLKEFERKYKHLKTIVQNDSDFDDSDGNNEDQIISSPVFSSPRGTAMAFKQPDSDKPVFFEGSIGDSFFDQVVNVSSGEPSKEDIQGITPRDVNGKAIINPEINQNTSKPEPPTISTSITTSTSSTPTPVTLPNFFMRPQELAESMRTLRIAANFPNSPRNSSRNSSACTTPHASSAGGATQTTTTATHDMHRMLRDQNVPIESTEMARIASIFSSNK